MDILITGASGLIGTALTGYFKRLGHQVYPMVRRESLASPFGWWPPANKIQWDPDIPLEAVINLAGSPIGDSRWTEKKKRLIFSSRVDSTRLLAETLANLSHKPKVLISSSGINYYGDTGNQAASEKAPGAEDFMANLARQWEAATQPAIEAGIRTVHLRTSLVLSTRGGALPTMLTPFRLGLGGRIGSGDQYMSWISIRDVVRVVEFLLDRENLAGPVNMASPNAVPNKDFTRALGQALHRPTIFPLPAFMARLLFGEMADHLLLASIRAYPQQLTDTGFSFTHADLPEALDTILQEGL